MKKHLLIVVLIVLLLVATACGRSQDPSVSNSETEAGVDANEVNMDSSTNSSQAIEPEKPYENACYSITISINPLVKLVLDKGNQVLGVECLNVDSEIVYRDILGELVGMSATDAASLIVTSAIEQGYLKDGASCTVSCDDIWEPSEELLTQFTQIQQSVQTVLEERERTDVNVVMEVTQAVENLEEAGVQVNEELKAEFTETMPDQQEANEVISDEGMWPNLLFIMKPGEIVEEVVYLNDSANRAYAGVSTNVVGMSDKDATRIYLAAAYENGYLRDQLNYTGKENIPDWVLEKLIVCRNYDEAILQGILPIPYEFYANAPRLVFIVDDDCVVEEVVYLNNNAATAFSGIELVGQKDMKALQKVISTCYNLGYIRFMNLPAEMHEYILTVCNAEEARALGYR